MDDRDGATPILLARDQPVAHAVVDRALAPAARFDGIGDGLDAVLLLVGEAFVQRLDGEAPLRGQLRPLRRRQLGPVGAGEGAVERAGIDHLAGADIRFRQRLAVPARRRDHYLDVQPELLRELEVSLVVGRDGHDHAGAVGGEHVVGHPDRYLLAVQGIRRVGAGEDAALLPFGRGTLDLGLPLGLLDVGLDGGARRSGRGQPLDQLVLGGEHHKGHAEHRVRPGREHGHLDALGTAVGRRRVNGEDDVGAGAAADPVFLHQLDARRPINLAQVREQLVGVGRDLEEPGRNLLLGHAGVVAPAIQLTIVAGLDFLVGHGGLADGAPPLPVGIAIGEAAFVEQQKEPLGPAVIVGETTVNLAVPVERDTDQAHLAFIVGGVAVGERPRRLAHFDGFVLGRLTERIPAHRVQHRIAAHTHEAAIRVGGDIVATVADGETVAGGIGKEVEGVELGLVGVLARAVEAFCLPPLLPRGLEVLWDIGPGDTLANLTNFCLRLRWSSSTPPTCSLSRGNRAN